MSRNPQGDLGGFARTVSRHLFWRWHSAVSGTVLYRADKWQYFRHSKFHRLFPRIMPPPQAEQAQGATVASTGNTLFGVTSAGGTSANGTLFSITTNGTAYSFLHNFSALDCGTGTNVDGATPWGNLVLNPEMHFMRHSLSRRRRAEMASCFPSRPTAPVLRRCISFTPMDPGRGHEHGRSHTAYGG